MNENGNAAFGLHGEHEPPRGDEPAPPALPNFREPQSAPGSPGLGGMSAPPPPPAPGVQQSEQAAAPAQSSAPAEPAPAPTYDQAAPDQAVPHAGNAPAPQGYAAPAPESDATPAAQSYGSPAAASSAAEAPAAASSTGMTPEEFKAKMRAAGLENPLWSLLVGVASYVGALFVSFLSLLGPVIMMALSGKGTAEELGSSVPVEELFGSTVSFLFRFPFQMVHMATFSAWGTTIRIPGEGAVVMSVRFVPLLTLAALVVLPFIGGRLLERFRPGGKLLGASVSAVLTALVVTILSALAALITAFRLDVPEANLKGTFHAIGFGSVFLTFLLVAVALLLGRFSARPAPAWWPIVSDLTAALRLAALHAVVIGFFVGAVVWIIMLVQSIGEENGPMGVLVLLVLVPLLAGPLIGIFAGWAMLSTVNVNASADLDGIFGTPAMSEGASVFALPWYAWLLILFVSLLVTVLMALPWSTGRRIVPGNMIALVISWIALPTAYFVGALVLMAVTYSSLFVGVRTSIVSSTSSADAAASISLAAWTPLLALLAGCIVELLARFAAPLVTPVIPPAIFGWFHGRGQGQQVPAAPRAVPARVTDAPIVPAVAPSAATGIDVATPALAPVPVAPAADVPPAGSAVAGSAAAMSVPSADAPNVGSPTVGSPTSAAPAGAPAAAAPAAAVPMTAPAGERAPMSARTKRLILIIGGALAALLVLLIGAIIAINVIASSVFGPSKPVEQYLDALKAGDAETAIAINDPNVPSAQRVLLTNPVATKAGDRISSYSISKVEVDGDVAHVTAKITQDGVTDTQSFTLDRTGRAYLVFPEWTVRPSDYPQVTVHVAAKDAKLRINGADVDFSKIIDESGVVTLPVLPGTYTADEIVTSDVIESVPAKVVVRMDGGDGGIDGEILSPGVKLTDAGIKQVNESVRKQLDECATQTSPNPDGCPFSVWLFGADTGTWKIDTYPEIEIADTEDDGYMISTTTAGKATFSYTQTLGDQKTNEKADTEFQVSGYVLLNDDGTVTADLSSW